MAFGVPFEKRRFHTLRLTSTATLLIFLLAPSFGWSAPWHRSRSIKMQATAFSQGAQPTSAGTVPHEGIVAADPAILPLGTRIRLSDAGTYNGIYTVTDTGNKINGRHIDIYIQSVAEAREFGKKMVRVQVLETGSGKKDARAKDIPAAAAHR
jgi:rare lipoprotein A